jgi:hypothetical protein
MNPLVFKQVGKSTYLNDPLDVEPIQIPIGERWSLSVNKSVLNCGDKPYIIKCDSPLPDCQTEHLVTKDACVISIDNDETAYISITVTDKDKISPFMLYYQEIVEDEIELVEIFEFDGGDISELAMTANSFNVGINITNYGAILYFREDYLGKTATISETNDVYLLNEKFCRNYSNKVGVTMCFREYGCYRLAFYKKLADGTLKLSSISGSISVISFKPHNTKIIEYYDEGLYHRHRVLMTYDSPQFLVEEEETILSTGKLNLSNTIIRSQTPFRAGLYDQDQHLELLRILKKGVKLDKEKIKLRGGYNIQDETVSRKYMALGNLDLVDRDIININNCSTSCTDGSSVTYVINEEKERYNEIVEVI